MQKTAQATGSRSAGTPFFGQQGPAETVPSTQASSAAAQQPPASGRSAGTPFFSEAGEEDRASKPPPPPNQQAQRAQAAARNRAQGPSQKTPDAKPTFQVIGMFLASLELLQQAMQQACKLTLAAAAPSALATWRLCFAVLQCAICYTHSPGMAQDTAAVSDTR